MLHVLQKFWQFYPAPNVLTHCGFVTPYGDIDLVNIDSEPMLAYHQWYFVAFT